MKNTFKKKIGFLTGISVNFNIGSRFSISNIGISDIGKKSFRLTTNKYKNKIKYSRSNADLLYIVATLLYLQ